MVWTSTGPKHLGLHGEYDQYGHWIDFPELLPDDERVMPDLTLTPHAVKCRCRDCCARASARLRGSPRR